MCKGRCAYITLPIIGVVLIAMGVAMPFVIRAGLDTALENGRRIPSSGKGEYWSDETYDNFVNSWDYRDYYLFNYTNVYNAITNGTILDVYVVGPFRFQRFRHKFDMEATNYNGTDVMQYLEWSEYLTRGDVTQNYNFNETIITCNPFYIAVVGASGSETNTLGSGLQVVLLALKQTYLSTWGQVTSALRFLSVRLYLLLLPKDLQDAGAPSDFYKDCSGANVYGCSPTGLLISQWFNSSESRKMSVDALKALYPTSNSTGFELVLANPLGVTDLDFQTALGLWNTASPGALTNTLGIQSWLQLCTYCITGTCTTTKASNIRTFMTGSGYIQQNSIPGICLWTGLLVGNGSALVDGSEFTNVVMPHFTSVLGEDIHDWPTLGARQFGSSDVLNYLTRGTTTETRDFSEWTETGSATEYGHYHNSTGLMKTRCPGCLYNPLTAAQTKSLFNLYSLTSASAVYIITLFSFVRETILIGGSVSANGYDTSIISQSLRANLQVGFCAQIQAHNLGMLVHSNGGLYSDCRNWLQLWWWLRDIGEVLFMDRVVRGSLAEINTQTGIGFVGGATPSGLFTKVTIRQMLNGFTDTLAAALGVKGHTGVIDIIVDVGGSANVSDEKRAIRDSFGTDRYFAENRGVQDWKRSREYIAYEGVTEFSTVAELYKSYCWTIGAAFCVALRKENNKVWENREVIRGTSSGNLMEPFADVEHNGAINELFIWFNDGNRVLPLDFTDGSKQVKGINVHKFVLNEEVFGHTTPNPNGTWYGPQYYNNGDPDGIVDVSTSVFDIPVVLSEPYFSSNEGGECLATINNINFFPDRTAYSSELLVEPWSGVTVSGTKKIQAAFQIKQYTFDSDYYRKLFTRNDTIYLPYYWADDNREIDDDDAQFFIDTVYGLRKGGIAMAVVLPVTGAVLIGLAVYIFKRDTAYTGDGKHMGGGGGPTEAAQLAAPNDVAVKPGTSTMGQSAVGDSHL